MTQITNPNHPVILFIPEAGIYSFLRGLSILGDAVMKNGGRVLITKDTGVMARSAIETKRRMPLNTTIEDKKPIYKNIEERIKIVTKKYGFEVITLSDFIDKQTIEEINNLVDGCIEDLQNIIFRGFPVGKIAQYDFILETKFPYSKEISSEHRSLYAAYIKNTAISIALTDKICEKYNPSLLLTFNEYAHCQGARYSAEKHGVSRMAITYPVNLNIDGSRLSIWKSTYESWRYKHCQNWNKVKDIPIRKEHVSMCWDDAIFRMYSSGSHIFSNKKINDLNLIYKKLNLDLKKKTIVVYTSSQDERTSVESALKIWGEKNPIIDAFPNQIEWLSFLHNYVKKRDDIQIIIRIHPREGLRQFGFDSGNLKKIKEKFFENDQSFMVVWPDDPISSYDLIELADVCLVSWSLVGQEAARLGVPVLSCTSNMFYPDDDFIQTAKNPEEYRLKLDNIINKKNTWNELVKSIRFYHWRIFLPSLDLGETVPKDFIDDTIWPEVTKEMGDVICDILSEKKDLISYNKNNWLQSITENSYNEESLMIKTGIRKFFDRVFYPPKTNINKNLFLIQKIVKKIVKNSKKPVDIFKDYQLEIISDETKIEEVINKTKQNKNLRVMIINTPHIILVHKGNVIRRMSPLLARLTHLYNIDL